MCRSRHFITFMCKGLIYLKESFRCCCLMDESSLKSCSHTPLWPSTICISNVVECAWERGKIISPSNDVSVLTGRQAVNVTSCPPFPRERSLKKMHVTTGVQSPLFSVGRYSCLISITPTRFRHWDTLELWQQNIPVSQIQKSLWSTEARAGVIRPRASPSAWMERCELVLVRLKRKYFSMTSQLLLESNF